MTALNAFMVAMFVAFPGALVAETYLLMAEEDGCIWCDRWDREIAHIYPKTAEGEVAPLRRYDLYGEPPEGVEFAQKVRLTPTFLLIQNGIEVGRIEGYPGKDFFWGLLGMMFEEARIELGLAG